MSLSWNSIYGENLDLKGECYSECREKLEGYEKTKECWNQTGTVSQFSDGDMYFLCCFVTMSSYISCPKTIISKSFFQDAYLHSDAQ